MRIDVHQHIWPAALIFELRRRSTFPRLDGWTLHLAGEPDFEVRPADHDVAARAALARADGLDLALVSLSSPLGIEWLAPDEADPLLAAYHDGAAELPSPFRAWAAAGLHSVDPGALGKELDRGFVGLQLPATALLDVAGYDRCAPLLEVLHDRDRPLFIHPGAAAPIEGVPAWWAALVPYPQQLHQAYWAWRAFGRSRYPRLRVCFTALAGLAPLHGERFAARGGPGGALDQDIFLETSSYGPRAIDATIRTSSIDVIVNGSDRPYAVSADHRLGSAAEHAICCTNPARLLGSLEATP
jgi:6-methylsalicylate decarboxylase